METILAIAFGRVLNLQNGEADDLTLAAQGIFRNSEKGTFPTARFLLSNFPFLVGFLRWRVSSDVELMKPQIVMYETALSLVKARREESATGSGSKVHGGHKMTRIEGFLFAICDGRVFGFIIIPMAM